MRVRAFYFTLVFVSVAIMIHGSEIQVATGWTGKVIARGARMHGANGIEFDSSGRLYIASLFGHNITVMDRDSGKILQLFGPDVGIKGPDDVAIGPDGTICWTELFQGEVGCLSPNGDKSTAALLPGAFNPIAFSSSGRLFVGQTCCDTGGLYEVDPQGIKEPRLIAKDLRFINGMDFGPDGFLYAAVTDQGKVIRINVNSGAAKTVADAFHTPVAVKFDSHGHLYLVDYATGEVVRIDVQTGAKEIIATIQPGLDNLALDSHDRLFLTQRIVLADQLERPAGFAATNDDLWVSDSGTGIVWQIVADGKRLKRPIQVISGLSAPEGLALLKEHLVVVESGAGRLLEINLSSNKIRTIASGLELGTNGASNRPAFHFFSGVAAGESGAVYVTGDQTNVLYRFERTKEDL